MPPPQYTFDADRLATLAGFNILDTPPERGFDDIVVLASQICQTPVALVSFVAENRQWFKARIGFEPCETDLDSSVCAHALVEPDLLVIPDLTQDSRTRDNPLVTGAPHIRFYAGAPLRTESGAVIGSLCVIDAAPRPHGLTDVQESGLRNLAGQVMNQLELRSALAERDAAIGKKISHDRQYRALFSAITDGFCLIEMKFVDGKAVDYRFIEVNPAFEIQTGLSDSEGKWMRDLAPDHEQHWFDIYGDVALTGKPARFEQLAAKLDNRWFEVHAFRVGDPTLQQVGILFSDKSDRKAAELMRRQAEEIQETLNQELSHRMKNTFAMVQAIASQTLRNVDSEAVAIFSQRIHALSAAHDVLLRNTWREAHISEVADAVIATMGGSERFSVGGPEVRLGARAALSLSLLLHELATNALKYGALSNDSGMVDLRWRIAGLDESAELVFDWREIGGPAVETQTPSRSGFGSKLTRTGLAGSGQVDLRYNPAGLEAEFRAPLSQLRGA
ncbi:MAG: sensor histidine kinase [Allorhizobium sp.]